MTLMSFIGRLLLGLICGPRRLIRDYLTIRRSRILDKPSYVEALPRADRWWAGRMPRIHYLIIGERLGLNPNPLFLTDYYRRQLPDGVKPDSLLVHYIKKGSIQGYRPNPFFSNYYLEHSHDVLGSDQHPLAHYYRDGWREFRNPHPAFDTKSYMQAHGLLPTGNQHPLVHFLQKDLYIPSELWSLVPGQPIESSKDPRYNLAPEIAADLIVPVYRRPDCVENLFESLFRDNDWERVRRCYIVDDCGDLFTTQYLKDLTKKSEKIVLIKNEENLGFLRSVNKAYQQAEAPYVILVNSDIQVPSNWMSRLLQPMEIDQKVALVTPLATSGINLSVALRPGQTWFDADAVIHSSKPKYPDACTAIGYLMAIRRSAIKTEKLFDEVFRHGYGEDTDLHYRLVSSGLRSVICDNLLVLHRGGASYLLDDQKSKIYEANRKVFFDRWSELHKVSLAKYEQIKPLQHVLTASSHSAHEVVGDSIDVLFVSPTNNRSIGGVKIIFEMADYLASHGLKVKVFCTEQTAPVSEHSHDYLMPIFLDSTLKRLVKSTKIVIGTGIGVAAKAREISQYFGAKRWWLAQGPECYFGDGSLYQAFSEELKSADHVVAVSEYLAKLAKDFGCQSITSLPLGPDPLVFYPRDVQRESSSIAIQLISTPDKGARFALSFAEAAKRHGLNVHFFGSGSLVSCLPKDLGTFHGRLDSDGLAKLFSRCEYYLDLSLMEGLGLLPLEAYFCGCRPVLTRKGAPELILQNAAGVIWLDSHLDYDGAIGKIKQASITSGVTKLQVSSRSAFARLLQLF